MTQQITLDDFRSRFPVGRDMHTGEYGWRRVNGCLNLCACGFRTSEEAEADRDSYFPDYARNPGDYSL